MSWNTIIGQQRVKDLLRKTWERGRVAHAYLFCGIEGVGKSAMAIEFGKLLNCERGGIEACDNCTSCKNARALQHPGIQLIYKLPVGKGEGKEDAPLQKLTEEYILEIRNQIALKAANPYHRIEISKANFIKMNSIREIRRLVSLSSFNGGKKVFIILDAEDLNAEASNALLKTLEEPPQNTILILTSSRKGALLPTIISRCQLVQFDVLSEPEIHDALMARDGVDAEQAEMLARLSSGSYSRAQSLLSRDMRHEQEEVTEFLKSILGSNSGIISTTIERLAATHDRASMEEWLIMLQSWLRDALLVKESGAGLPPLVHPSNALNTFNERFPQANLIQALESVDRQIALLNKNVYLPLVLTALSIDLKRHLAS